MVAKRIICEQDGLASMSSRSHMCLPLQMEMDRKEQQLVSNASSEGRRVVHQASLNLHFKSKAKLGFTH